MPCNMDYVDVTNKAGLKDRAKIYIDILIKLNIPMAGGYYDDLLNSRTDRGPYICSLMRNLKEDAQKQLLDEVPGLLEFWSKHEDEDRKREDCDRRIINEAKRLLGISTFQKVESIIKEDKKALRPL